MTPLFHYSLVLLFLTTPSSSQTTDDSAEAPASFHISVSVLVTVFSLMFALACLLLVYVKLCHPTSTITTTTLDTATADHRVRSSSGIDVSVINSLPVIRFSSLGGSSSRRSSRTRDCSVCLSRFLDDDALRLLPNCNHAFHAPCINRWLRSHSTCPLCRRRISTAELLNLKYSASTKRFSSINYSPARLDQNPEVEIFVEGDGEDGNNYIDNAGNKLRDPRVLVLKSRWSDVDLADIEGMRSELAEEESSVTSGERDSRKLLGKGRCMSEIMDASRFESGRGENGLTEMEMVSDDERVRRVWLPIARRTVEWFAGRERNSN